MQTMDLDALLDQLLMQDPTEATRDLSERLAETAWHDMDEAQITRILAAVLPFLSRLAGRLRTSLRQSGLPLSGQGLNQLNALLRIYRNAQLMLNLKLTTMQEQAQDSDSEAYLVRAHQDRVDWAVRSILDCYTAYVDVPSSLYVDLHQLVDLAQLDLAQAHPTGWQGIYHQYVAILTLAMTNPYGMTRDEMEDGYACLMQVGQYIDIVHEQPTRTSRFIDVTGKIMPHIALTPRSDMAASGLFIDVGNLYQPSILATLPPQCRVKVQHLLNRLQFYFVSHAPRARADVPAVTEKLSSLITLGYLSVHHRLERLVRHEHVPTSTMSLAGLDWEGLEQPIRGDVQPLPGADVFKMDIDTTSAGHSVDWDEQAANSAGCQPARALNVPSLWDVVNLSPTGFRLHWRLASNSRAAVDDLLLAELPPSGSEPSALALGVVRWVRHMDATHSTLDMGVQRLCGDVLATYARDHRAAGSRWSKSWPVLALVDEQSVIIQVIVPTLLVEETQEILLMREEHEIHIRLGAVYQTGQGFLIMEAHRVDA